MKKIIYAFLGVAILLSSFSIVYADVDEKWTNPLNLSNSISSSIFKLDDGFLVMQYEGSGSSDNFLKKYSFDGKLIWEKDNTYGYNIVAVDGGFYVSSGQWRGSIFKFDNDGNLLNTTLVENDAVGQFGFSFNGSDVFRDDYNPYKLIVLDNNGNYIKTTSLVEMFGLDSSEMFISATTAENGDLILFTFFNNKIVCVRRISKTLEVLEDYIYKLENDYYKYNFKDVLISEDNYILYGADSLIFNRSSKSFRLLEDAVFDAEVIGDYIYSYESRDFKKYKFVYTTCFVKYDSDFNVVTVKDLPLMFSDSSSDNTGSVTLKNRAVFIENEDSSVDIILLNTPFLRNGGSNAYGYVYNSDGSELTYGVARYSVNDVSSDVKDETVLDDIINNNPETISFDIIVFFVLLILAFVVYYYSKNKKIKYE